MSAKATDPNQPDSEYGEHETKRRMEDALRRALTTPPKPHSEMKKPRITNPKQNRKAAR